MGTLMNVYIEIADAHPYDTGEDGAIPAGDWAVRAARCVVSDLMDRRGIKQELRNVDIDVRQELIQSLADIIREIHRQEN